MTGFLVRTIEDVQQLPKGELYRLDPQHFYMQTLEGRVWRVAEFSEADVHWAYKCYARLGEERRFSTQSELMLFAIYKSPVRATWRGFPTAVRGAWRHSWFEVKYRLEAPIRQIASTCIFRLGA